MTDRIDAGTPERIVAAAPQHCPIYGGNALRPARFFIGALQQRKFISRRIPMHTMIRKAMLPVLAAMTIGAATPVLAADVGISQPYMTQAPAGPVTLQEALVIASGIGVVTVQNTNFAGDQWEIEGHDSSGRWLEVDVDSRTGEIRDVDRSIL
jgi:hypothetical protein